MCNENEVLPSLVGLSLRIAPQEPRSVLRRGDSSGEGSAPAKTSDKFPHLREVTRRCCVENGCADRWVATPNGAPASRGRSRLGSNGPTLALWRSAWRGREWFLCGSLPGIRHDVRDCRHAPPCWSGARSAAAVFNPTRRGVSVPAPQQSAAASADR
jgi:hypothetical protein